MRRTMTELSLLAQPESLPRARELIDRAARDCPFSPQEIDALKIAACEALSNAILHAGCETVLVRISPNGRTMTVEIIDDGPGFDFSRDQAHFPGPESMSGRGIPLMMALVDEAVFKSRPGGGITVRLTKRHSGPAAMRPKPAGRRGLAARRRAPAPAMR